jgi:hypothetical protein
MTTRPHRTVHGELLYTSRAPGREGRERGREFFTITTHADGARTLQAHCEIDDAPPVIRDVTLAFAPDGRPTDCAVRLSVGDRFMGSSWFRFRGRELECEGWTAAEGRVSQQMVADAPILAFGTHPIQADALLLQVADRTVGQGWQTFPELYLCSLDHRGASGPLLFRHPIGVRIAYVGAERIDVLAGSFDAWHYRIGDSGDVDALEEGSTNAPGKHPPYDLWVTTDGAFTLLKAQVTGYMQTHYELKRLDVY